MRKIYIDSDFKCHVVDDGTMTAVETDIFDGKCDLYIEGHRFVPAGKSWTCRDGVVFHGEMKTMLKSCSELDSAQRKYEKEQYEDMQNALAILMGGETV